MERSALVTRRLLKVSEKGNYVNWPILRNTKFVVICRIDRRENSLEPGRGVICVIAIVYARDHESQN